MANPDELKPESVGPEAKRVSEKTSFVEGIDTDYVNAFPTILTYIGLLKQGQLLELIGREDFIAALEPLPTYEDYIKTRPGHGTTAAEVEEIIGRASQKRRAEVNAQIRTCNQISDLLMSVLRSRTFGIEGKAKLAAPVVKKLGHEFENLSRLIKGEPVQPYRKEESEDKQ